MFRLRGTHLSELLAVEPLRRQHCQSELPELKLQNSLSSEEQLCKVLGSVFSVLRTDPFRKRAPCLSFCCQASRHPWIYHRMDELEQNSRNASHCLAKSSFPVLLRCFPCCNYGSLTSHAALSPDPWQCPGFSFSQPQATAITC